MQQSPYQPPAEMESFSSDDEIQIKKALIMLGAGKGHLGIINELRRSGLSYENAKAKSYPVFDEAKRRLMREQRHLVFVGWGMIALGFAMPAIIILMKGLLIYLAGAPILMGALVLNKVIRPQRLP